MDEYKDCKDSVGLDEYLEKVDYYEFVKKEAKRRDVNESKLLSNVS